MQAGLSVVACWQSQWPFVIEYASQGSYPTGLKYRITRVCQCHKNVLHLYMYVHVQLSTVYTLYKYINSGMIP